MAANILLNLVENIQTWDKLEKRIAALPTEMERGNAFEEFCHAFFLLDPVFQFKLVYRHTEIPPSIRERLGYPGVQDLGIDGVGITDDNRLINTNPNMLITNCLSIYWNPQKILGEKGRFVRLRQQTGKIIGDNSKS